MVAQALNCDYENPASPRVGAAKHFILVGRTGVQKSDKRTQESERCQVVKISRGSGRRRTSGRQDRRCVPCLEPPPGTSSAKSSSDGGPDQAGVPPCRAFGELAIALNDALPVPRGRSVPMAQSRAFMPKRKVHERLTGKRSRSTTLVLRPGHVSVGYAPGVGHGSAQP